MGDKGLFEYLEDIIGTNKYISYIEDLATKYNEVSSEYQHTIERIGIQKHKYCSNKKIGGKKMFLIQTQFLSYLILIKHKILLQQYKLDIIFYQNMIENINKKLICEKKKICSCELEIKLDLELLE